MMTVAMINSHRGGHPDKTRFKTGEKIYQYIYLIETGYIQDLPTHSNHYSLILGLVDKT